MFNPYHSASVSDAGQLADKPLPARTPTAWVGAKIGLKCSAVVVGGLLAAVLSGDLIYLIATLNCCEALVVGGPALGAAVMCFAIVCPLAMIIGIAFTGIAAALPSADLDASAPTDPFADDA